MTDVDSDRVVEFLRADEGRESRLAAFDAVVASGKALRVPLPEALEALAWIARHHPDRVEAARLAVELVAVR